MSCSRDCRNWPWTRRRCGTVLDEVGLEMVDLNLKEQRGVENGAALRRLSLNPSWDELRARRSELAVDKT